MSSLTTLESVTGEAARPDSPTMQRVTNRKKRQDPAWATSGPAELVIGAEDDEEDEPQRQPKPSTESKVHGRSAALAVLKSESSKDLGGLSREDSGTAVDCGPLRPGSPHLRIPPHPWSWGIGDWGAFT